MDAYFGTSGYSYDFWRGTFYPEDLEADRMLGFYAATFRTVEINNTFYRIPKADVVKRWAQAVPASFRFVIKASRRITHLSRLEGEDDSLEYLYTQLEPLEDKLGAVLFQCPPRLTKDAERLKTFLERLPSHGRAVLEFRHRTWFCPEIYDLLRAHGAALCLADYKEGEVETLPEEDDRLISTAGWGYLRLRAERYEDDELRNWIDRFDPSWTHAFTFFKHEERGPELVERMQELWRERSQAAP